jgi:hypothetical protein
MTDKYFGKTYNEDWGIPLSSDNYGSVSLKNQNPSCIEREPLCDHCGNKISKDMIFCPQCGTELKPQDNELLTELKQGIKEYKVAYETHTKNMHYLFEEYAEQTTAQLNHTHKEITECLKAKFPVKRRYDLSLCCILGFIFGFCCFGYTFCIDDYLIILAFTIGGLALVFSSWELYGISKYQCQWCHEFTSDINLYHNHTQYCLNAKLKWD